VQSAPLTSSEKTEVLRRQAFKCNQCQADLEPIGSSPAHFYRTGMASAKGASATANVVALCPSCLAKSDPEPEKSSEAKKRRQRDSEPARTAKKFVKTGFDTRKF
jgi:5-methylcytosine-specific restriction endonuclease McrA